ncbi:MAG: hypothetical protein ACKPJQ_20050 [Dolichospermum sp.]
MNKLNQLLMGTTTLLLTAVMLTSCGGGTSSNTGRGTSSNTGGGTSSNTGDGTSSNTSSTGGTKITPPPQRSDYTSQCNTSGGNVDFACVTTQTSKWQQDLNQWQRSITGSSGGNTDININLRRQNAQDTYTDCVRFGADNCDLDLRGVP